jgi:hypothetical protein
MEAIMKTKAKRKLQVETDTYMTLIQRLPLKPIKSDDQHEQAVGIIGELID